MEAGSVVEHEVVVAAPPETVFDFFTNPEKLVRWMGDEATLDPRPGGVCRVGFAGARMVGEYLDVVPPTRVVLRWGWGVDLLAVPPASTLVEVSLSAVGSGTRVRVTHRRLPDGSLDFHGRGWRHYLARLVVASVGGDPGPDQYVSPMAVRG